MFKSLNVKAETEVRSGNFIFYKRHLPFS